MLERLLCTIGLHCRYRPRDHVWHCTGCDSRWLLRRQGRFTRWEKVR